MGYFCQNLQEHLDIFVNVIHSKHNITLGARGFFFLLFAAKIEQRSQDRDRCFAVQFALQTTERKPLAPRAGLFKAGLR